MTTFDMNDVEIIRIHENRKLRAHRAANKFFVDHIIESMMDFSTDLPINCLRYVPRYIKLSYSACRTDKLNIKHAPDYYYFK